MSDRPLPPMSPYPSPSQEIAANAGPAPKTSELFYFVFDCMEQGENREEICNRLETFGYSPQSAALIVADVAERRRHFLAEQEANRQGEPEGTPGRKNMIVGGVIFSIGFAITLLSYLVARERGSGVTIIAYGALIWGVIQFVRGWMQSNQNG